MLQMSTWKYQHLYVWSSLIPRPHQTGIYIDMRVIHPLLTLSLLLTHHSKHTVQFEKLKTLTDKVDTANQINLNNSQVERVNEKVESQHKIHQTRPSVL